jgi:hypothetical protein
VTNCTRVESGSAQPIYTSPRDAIEEEHLAHSNGRLLYVTNPDGAQAPLPDRLPNLQALDRLQRIEDQRNRLLSTYAPLAARIEIVPRDAVERMVRENEEQIAALERDLELPPGG